MRLSFSRLFLGKKAITIDEDVLPCRPRKVVLVVVDAKTTEAKFSLTKIGRALKHKLHLNTLAPVPVGHGPLAVTTDEVSLPFSRKMQTPTTPSLPSLPHVPEVSSTLRREIRIATRHRLLAATGGANTQFTIHDIYKLTPCQKRRTRSSSVLGGTDLPRPGTPLDVGGLRRDGHDPERHMLNSSIPPVLLYPTQAPMIWDEATASSSDHNEVPEVLPLSFERYCPPSSPPLIGRTAIVIPQPAIRPDWYTQQYVQANADWSLPRLPASEPASSPNESLPSLTDLSIERRERAPASSVYSPFVPTYNADTSTGNQDFFSPQNSQLYRYSPIKLSESPEFFPYKLDRSPIVVDSAREALPSSHADAFYYEHGQALEDSTTFSAEQLGQFKKDAAAARTFSASTTVMHIPRKDMQRSLHDAQLQRKLTRYALEVIPLRGPERRTEIIAEGPSRILAGYDLFTSEEQQGVIYTTSTASSECPSPVDSTGEAFGTRPEQIDWTDPSSPISDDYDDNFIAEAYQSAVADVPSMTDVLKSSKFSNVSPQKQHVTFAKVRRVITLAGTVREEYEGMRDRKDPSRGRQVSTFVDLLSEMQDLKDDWYHDDQDFLHIGKHVAGYEIPQDEINRDNATKDALTCLQTRLASAHTKLAKFKFHKQLLESQHQHSIKVAERAAFLANEVTLLQYRENPPTVVFVRMMTEKLVEIASKESEIEALRTLCNNELVTKELAGLRNALWESHKSRLNYLQLAEGSSDLLKRADERQALAEHNTETARIAQTFAEMNQQCTEKLYEDMRERILELEAERDEAIEGREMALIEVERLQHEKAALRLSLAKQPISTTPLGSPSTTPLGSPIRHHELQIYSEGDTDEEDAWDIESEDEAYVSEGTESLTEEHEDWGSDIF